jgi:hypothetical protein
MKEFITVFFLLIVPFIVGGLMVSANDSALYPASSVDILKGPVGQKVYLIQDKDVLSVYKTVNQVCPAGYNILKDGVVPYPKNINWVIIDCL